MQSRLALHRYSLVTAAFAAFVIFAGAMVTSTGSGMSVPDWPQSFGTWTPKMTGGVFYEHGHRVVAGALGLLVLALALWAAASETRRWARLITWGALIAVVAQAGLGGLTVLRGTFFDWGHTDPIFSAMHATLAQSLFAALAAYATVTAPSWGVEADKAVASRSLARWSLGLACLVFVQIVLGAVMRHHQAGLIIYDFPLSYGKVIPTFYNWLVVLNFSHRVGGWLIAGFGTAFAARVWFDKELSAWVRRPAGFMLGAIGAQFLLGASVVWTRLGHPILTSAHVLGGSAVFAGAIVLAIRLRRAAQGKA